MLNISQIKPLTSKVFAQTLRANFSLKQTRAQPSSTEIKNSALLCEYASLGQLDEIKALVKKGVDVNSCDYDFRSALHIASAVGQKEIVEWLIQNKANNVIDRFGGLPIHDALRNNHVDIAQFLTENEENNAQFATSSHHQEQMETVFQLIVKEEIFSFSVIANEVDYYYNQLGLDLFYFEYFTAPQIAKHIHSLIAAKKIAEIGEKKESIELSIREKDEIFFLCSERNSHLAYEQVEDFIRSVSSDQNVSFNYVKSSGPVLPGQTDKLEIYVAKIDNYENPDILNDSDVYNTSTTEFLQSRNAARLADYQTTLNRVMSNPNQCIFKTEQTKLDGKKETKIMFGVNQGRSSESNHNTFLGELKHVISHLKIDIHKIFQESFANGVVVYSFYTNDKISDKLFEDVKNFCSLMLIFPKGTDADILKNALYTNTLSGSEALYTYMAGRFTYYFVTQMIEEFEDLYKYLKNDQIQQNKLVQVKQKFASETITQSKIFKTMLRNPEIISALFQEFSIKCNGPQKGEVQANIEKLISSSNLEDGDRDIYETFQKFNNSITKTNFFKADKCAVGFRLSPEVFLKDMKLPEIPFAIFQIAGHDFSGFHIRFRDISRGGIRLIKSREDTYDHNRATQFQENYALAYTQKLKNKDIPESGSKGTILMRKGRNHMEQLAFMQYMDTMTDLMLVKEGVTDLYKEAEYLFFGPDENTADKMDKSCLFMKGKGYEQWKSITTGKNTKLGGIPHDVYGMTTRSVRMYTKGIQEKLGLKQSECTKFITGGADGDLGSNEIFMGEEKIVGIVDGSGVLVDPNGIDRAGLLFLVTNRMTVENFNGQLSEEGYLIKITDNNVKLPDGRIIESGINYRNTAHLDPTIKADFFCPCGGRPETINTQNVDKLFLEDNTPRFPYIVEGANLFITEPARQILEDAGIILFKDASTNKGGVTSSSLEVLACLAMEDKMFKQHMTGDEAGLMPEFYKSYVQEIIGIVEENARMEFEFIWNERLKSGKRSIELTNEVSENINNLGDVILDSDLFNKQQMKENVLKELLPKTLMEKVGYENIIKRVPDSYLKAMFAKYLAAKFNYTQGAKTNLYQFYNFMKQYN